MYIWNGTRVASNGGTLNKKDFYKKRRQGSETQREPRIKSRSTLPLIIGLPTLADISCVIQSATVSVTRVDIAHQKKSREKKEGNREIKRNE